MTKPVEDYTPLIIPPKIRKQAFGVWIIGLLGVSAWVLMIVGAPLLKANGFDAVSSPLYHFFSFICHQIPSRSMHIEGEQFGVCSRCFGVYFGLLLGFGIYPIWRRIDNIESPRRFWLFLSLIPISIDWSLTVFSIWENTHLSRFITGTILGVVCATFIIPALVEITRNLGRNFYRR